MHGGAPWWTHADDAFLLGYRKLADFLLFTRRSTREWTGIAGYLGARVSSNKRKPGMDAAETEA
jgi:hypothetical protein